MIDASPEQLAEEFIQAAVDASPEPLKRLGRFLSEVLDEDQWKMAERMLLGATFIAARGDKADAVPDRNGLDGTARLCRALYGRKETTRDYIGGSDARMLHDAADRLDPEKAEASASDQGRVRELEAEVERLQNEAGGEFVEAAVRAMQANPGFEARDYAVDGITADDFERFFTEDMNEAWSQVERLRERVQAAEAALKQSTQPTQAGAGVVGEVLWAVHVRGPDDVVAVPSYEDAVRLSDGLNWWWAAQRITENDPIISAVPMIYDGTPEHHAEQVVKLGTRGYDYGIPSEEQVDRKMWVAVNMRIAAAQRESATAPQPPTDPSSREGVKAEGQDGNAGGGR